ncbi:hypothetical protein [Microbacterium sp. XT11]|uniref:hypothetical protein n=1 Tax=Microbacterium sp. XT11 TaxID=367477 RepID=UPI00082CC7AF|nr:hypothetical protein [Microbacterium sp. XT11]
MQRKPYLVTVHPEGRWWHVRVPELGPAAVSQALKIRETEHQARDLIATWLDVEPHRFHVIIKRRSALHPMWSDSLLNEGSSSAPAATTQTTTGIMER